MSDVDDDLTVQLRQALHDALDEQVNVGALVTGGTARGRRKQRIRRTIQTGAVAVAAAAAIPVAGVFMFRQAPNPHRPIVATQGPATPSPPPAFVSPSTFNVSYKFEQSGLWKDNRKSPDATGAAGYVTGGSYEIDTRAGGRAYAVQAPLTLAQSTQLSTTSSIVVKATGRLLASSQGGWGVWCQGNNGDRYAFRLSHSGHADFDTSIGFYPAPNSGQHFKLNPTWNVIQGQCRVNRSGGVSVSMSVNGHKLSDSYNYPRGVRAGVAPPTSWSAVGAYTFRETASQAFGRAVLQEFSVQTFR